MDEMQSLRTSAVPLVHRPLERGALSAAPQLTEVAAARPAGHKRALPLVASLPLQRTSSISFGRVF